MRFSEAWLRENVNPPVSTQTLVEQLTMAGLEVDAVEPAAGYFDSVVVGEVLEVVPHPHADRLKLCKVRIGEAPCLQIVCGAPNVVPGMRAPTALPGAILPGDVRIGRAELRGVASAGMLCSAKELGLDSSADGLMSLPEDAPVGADIRQYLQLNDSILTLDLTPNRADCLSIRGIAREVAVLNKLDWKPRPSSESAIRHEDSVPVHVSESEACPRYLGRLLTALTQAADTPLWIRERLRRSGIRSLGPIVDVTNYVLLELGQPLHAFDAAKLTGGLQVRLATSGERIVLLNDQTVALDEDVLVIADAAKPLAIAGIMGGKDSAVSEATTDIFLECAFFAPAAIAGKARRYGLATESSHRFERGIDPELQHNAIERATELLVAITGGQPGPISEVCHRTALPAPKPIVLRKTRIEKILGLALAESFLLDTLRRLGMDVVRRGDGDWQVTPPAFRFDLAIEVDLIEELARVYGYQRLPQEQPILRPRLLAESEAVVDIERVKDLLSGRGYREAITYSFVDASVQNKIEPHVQPITLKNPISSDLAVMRTSLWCGLLQAALRNQNRQQTRVRLFEVGLVFSQRGNEVKQEKRIAGIALGSLYEEQWGVKTRAVDFYDAKSDIEALLALKGNKQGFAFAPAQHPALHPGQAAEVLNSDGECIATFGMLHPRLEEDLGVEARVFLFEVKHDLFKSRTLPSFQSLSKFPQVRRDLAVVVDAEVPVASLIDCVHGRCGSIVRQVKVFDVYQGEGIDAGRKSVGLGVILQDHAKTLTDEIVDACIADIVQRLAITFNAKLRE